MAYSNLLETLTSLGSTIGIDLLKEADEFKPGVCFYPGSFKPPHKGHFNVAKYLSSRAELTKIIIIISKPEREGITAEQSFEIWQEYLKENPLPRVSVMKSQNDSPIEDIFGTIEAGTPTSTYYIVAGKGETDDKQYIENLEKKFPGQIRPIFIEEKFGSISASDVRDILRKGDEESFKLTVPDSTKEKGSEPEIYSTLKKSIKEAQEPSTEPDKQIALPDTYASPEALKRVLSFQGYTLLEAQDNSEQEDSLLARLKHFTDWCQQMLEIESLPEITFVTTPEFSKTQCSFGGYNPLEKTITLSIHKRHPVDIMRTLAHELVHCRQDETTGINYEDGKTGSGAENEANSVAGMIMRTYGRMNPEIFEYKVYEGTPSTSKIKQ